MWARWAPKGRSRAASPRLTQATSVVGEDLADVLGAMATGGAYVNVHSTQHRGGEIRGQVTVD